MHHRGSGLFAIVAVCLCFWPAALSGQEAADAAGMEVLTAATIIMVGDLEFAALEVPGLDTGMEVAGLYGDFTAEGPYALRLSFPDGYRFPAHFHPMDKNLTVISGTLLLAMGDTVDESQLVAYGPGEYLNLPAKHPHFGGATGHTVIQLHGIGPFEIILVE